MTDATRSEFHAASAAEVHRPDYEHDISDVWAEATDPDGEFGETADAMFRVTYDCDSDHRGKFIFVDTCQLIGLRVTDTGGSYTYSRIGAKVALGASRFYDIENMVHELLNETAEADASR